MATAILLSLVFLLLFVPNFAESQSNNFTFNGFNGADHLSLDGSSTITTNGLLQLTNQSHFLVGHAFYSSPFNMFNNSSSPPKICSFSTSFVFAIVPADPKMGGGHGFTFTISPSNQLPGASPSHYLGLFNSSNHANPSNHVFAIEFDTVNAVEEIEGLEKKHVGINLNSIESLVSKTASYYDNSNKWEEIDLESGKPIQVWVDYDGVQEIVNVTISPINVPKPIIPLLSHPVNLSIYLVKSMYVGFSSSTAKLSSSHYILGWSFRMNGQAFPLDLSLLPSLPSGTSSKFTKKIVLVIIIVSFLFMATVIFVIYYRLKKRRQSETLEDWELDCPHRFRYKDLYVATNCFKASEVIGIGGFGVVYKGVLPKTREEVAVKKILNNSIKGVREFVAEIESLGRLRHKHLVHLLGWCKRKEDLLLVYDFVPNGSLDSVLFNRKADFILSWEQRFKILKGIALGLLYMHEEWDQVVVHRDIKASNVLLDADMNGRLGDFGLARLYNHGENPRTTHVVGTLGYIAPELARTGKATTSSDVFAYGILLLVVACGIGSLGPISYYSTLLDWVCDCHRMGRILDAVDPKLMSSYVVEEMEMVLKLGLLCSQSKPESRPSMRQVTRYFNGDDLLPSIDVSCDVYLHVEGVESRFSDVIVHDATLPSRNLSISSNFLEAGQQLEHLIHM